uniref:Uncharacterized protein n=1 Tax=Cacopsylla melanoneura TaxID=428564 RepID=A0A8D8XEJ7_9HEMI
MSVGVRPSDMFIRALCIPTLFSVSILRCSPTIHVCNVALGSSICSQYSALIFNLRLDKSARCRFSLKDRSIKINMEVLSMPTLLNVERGIHKVIRLVCVQDRVRFEVKVSVRL